MEGKTLKRGRIYALCLSLALLSLAQSVALAASEQQKRALKPIDPSEAKYGELPQAPPPPSPPPAQPATPVSGQPLGGPRRTLSDPNPPGSFPAANMIPEFGQPLPAVQPGAAPYNGPGFAGGAMPEISTDRTADEQRIGRLEQVAFGNTYPEHEVEDRLDHLETEVFGTKSGGQPVEKRIGSLETKLGAKTAFGQPPVNTPVGAPPSPGQGFMPPTGGRSSIQPPSPGTGFMPPQQQQTAFVPQPPTGFMPQQQPPQQGGFMPQQQPSQPMQGGGFMPAQQPRQGFMPQGQGGGFVPQQQTQGGGFMPPQQPQQGGGFMPPQQPQQVGGFMPPQQPQQGGGFRGFAPQPQPQFGGGFIPAQQPQQFGTGLPQMPQNSFPPQQPQGAYQAPPQQQYPPRPSIQQQPPLNGFNPAAQPASYSPTRAGVPPYSPPAASNATAIDQTVRAIPEKSGVGDYASQITKFENNAYARWTSFPIMVHLPGGTPENWGKILEAAVGKWNQYLPVRVAAPTEPADVEVAWINHLPPRQLGLTNLEVFNGRMRVTVYLLRPTYYLPSTPEKTLNQVALHEIGHAIGLFGHSADPADAMFPTEAPAGKEPIKSKSTGITARDLNTLKKVYLSPSLPPGYQTPHPYGWSFCTCAGGAVKLK